MSTPIKTPSEEIDACLTALENARCTIQSAMIRQERLKAAQKSVLANHKATFKKLGDQNEPKR